MDPVIQGCLNKRLFKSVSKNDVKEIRRLIAAGADVNCEFSVEELISFQLVDEKAARKFKAAETTIEEVLRRGLIKFDLVGLEDALGRKLADESGNGLLLPLRNSELIQLVKNGSGPKIIMFTFSLSSLILSYNSCLSSLQLAVLFAWKPTIVELVRCGAFLNKKTDIQGLSVLHLMYTPAVLCNQPGSYAFDEEIYQILIDEGADPNQQDGEGRSVMHYTLHYSEYVLDNLTVLYKPNILSVEIGLGTRTFTCFDFSRNVHDWANKLVEMFLISGANPNLVDDSSGHSLLFAIYAHEEYAVAQPTMSRLFFDHGYKMEDIPDQSEGPSRMFPFLKKNFLRIGEVMTCLDKFSKGHGESARDFVQAVLAGQTKKVSRLCRSGTSPNMRNESGSSVLHLAVKKGDLEMVKLLLEKGANANIRGWKSGTTPLFNAVINGNIEVAKALLIHGAKPSVKSTSGLSPLYFGVTSSNHEMTRLLTSRHATPDISPQLPFLISLSRQLITNHSALQTSLAKVKKLCLYLKKHNFNVDCSQIYMLLESAEEKCNQDSVDLIKNLLNELVCPQS